MLQFILLLFLRLFLATTAETQMETLWFLSFEDVDVHNPNDGQDYDKCGHYWNGYSFWRPKLECFPTWKDSVCNAHEIKSEVDSVVSEPVYVWFGLFVCDCIFEWGACELQSTSDNSNF